jgi:ribonuclease-3
LSRDAEIAALEDRLGHRFADRGLLEQALTHSSHSKEELLSAGPDNEPLEFLGDAVLGFLVAELLHRRDPSGDEGGKTKARAALVSRPALARQAEALGLPGLLRFGRGEERAGGRQKTALWADAFEAVLAALYLDGGLEAARRLVEARMGTLLGLAVLDASDAKSALQELLQARGEPVPEYVVVQELGPDHRKGFRVECRLAGGLVAVGEGFSKKAAQQEAARAALDALREPAGG